MVHLESKDPLLHKDPNLVRDPILHKDPILYRDPILFIDPEVVTHESQFLGVVSALMATTE